MVQTLSFPQEITNFRSLTNLTLNDTNFSKTLEKQFKFKGKITMLVNS